jgi:hypothetical protein
MSSPDPPQPTQCPYCPHPAHGQQKCGVVVGPKNICRCKGKPGFWRGFLDGLGNAIGEAKFGG